MTSPNHSTIPPFPARFEPSYTELQLQHSNWALAALKLVALVLRPRLAVVF